MLLHYVANVLFKIYQKMKSDKEILDSLEGKYGTEGLGTRKHVVSRWMKFQMEDSKLIMSQIHECETLVSEVLVERIQICEYL